MAFANLIYSKLNPPTDPTPDLSGKTVLLTGGNSGLGLEAAIKYVTLGVTSLIIGCRSVERGNEAKDLIEQQSQRQGVVQIWPLDMSSFQSVEEFANRVNKEVPHLEIALMNAGLHNREHVTSPDGWEETLQVNTLSTALLALLLLPKLRASGTQLNPTHLSFVSSGLIATVDPNTLSAVENPLQELNKGENYNRSRYAVSKYLLECVVKHIADLTRRENGQVEVIVNSVCPGLCRSGLSRQYSSFYERLAIGFFGFLFARTSEQGSRSLVSATLQGEESHGKVWKNDHYPEYVLLIQMRLDSEEKTKEIICRRYNNVTGGKEIHGQVWTELIDILQSRSLQVNKLLAL